MAHIRRNTIQCEHPLGCTNTVEEIAHEQAHSMLVVLQKVVPSGYSFYQCAQGATVDYHNLQHWHCSHEHMKEGVKDCISNHYNETKLSGRRFTRFGYFHKVVLGSGLSCKICNEPLADKAYRFCLTMATPICYVPDNSTDTFEQWCCSLDHARQNAINTIETLEARPYEY